MIKVTYYVGTNDKDTLRPELYKIDFIKLFDELFKDYTLVEDTTDLDGYISLYDTVIVEGKDLYDGKIIGWAP